MKSDLYSLFQPIVDIRAKKLLGYEALTRRRGKRTSPSLLLRRAYDTGTTVELDLACLRSAFAILPQLRRKELLFVNVEPLTLASLFAEGKERTVLLDRIASYARQVVFELTEGMKGRDFEFVKKGVSFIKSYGCRFALDDVAGVGFKLIQLLSLKPHFIKIDISLVRGLQKSRTQREIVSSLISLGKMSRSLLIAEGVEREKDLTFVDQMEIPYVQGFYFGRPQKRLLKDNQRGQRGQVST